MSTEPRYHINVFWHPDDQCWIADVPDLRPCSAQGDTPAQAVSEVIAAIDLWLETARAADQPVPELGLTTFAQIAALSEADLAELDGKLGAFAGRPARDSWVEQAQFLAAGNVAGFEGKFGKV